MMKIIPNLSFDGKCEAAFTLYAACLGGEIAYLKRYSDSGASYPPKAAEKVFHATLTLGDQVLSGRDVADDRYEKPQGFFVQINLSDSTKARRIFDALSADGVIQFPLQATFWAAAYGVLIDQFGIPWKINCGDFADPV